MSHQKKKQPKRRTSSPPGEAGRSLALLRRLPRPVGARPDWVEPAGWRGVERPHPAMLEIVELLRTTCALAGLSPYTVLKDFVGMMEAAFKYRGDNLKAMAATGQFVTDPPEVAEHFRRARERYLRASAQRPAVYRVMQESFARATALLSQAAAPGLAWFGQQEDLNPDLIGQVFVTLLNPGPIWRQFFPPWFAALTLARARCPAGQEVVDRAIVAAALAQRDSGAPRIELEPGVNWAEWYQAVQPYFEPVLIGPAVIDSGAVLLAAAAQFPTWAVQHGLVRFVWAGVDPLLLKMANLNAMLFGLNRYDLDLFETELEIQQLVETQPVLPPLPEQAVYLAPPEEETPPAPTGDKAATFEALFRRRPA